MNKETKTNRAVGLFVFIGIIITCAMIIHFGKVGDRFRGGFPITVEFNNAGGLVRGAQVLYSGVLVGKVTEIKLNPKQGNVDVEINLFDQAGIRSDSQFLIKQSGLLGDQNIVIMSQSEDAPLIKAGDRIRGLDPFDFSEAATQAGEALKKLNTAIDRFSSAVIQEDTLANLKKGLENFSQLSASLHENSEKLNGILSGIQNGEGTVGRLVTDQSLFDEINRLIHNWRVHGLLYREKADESYPSPRKGAYPGD